MVFANQGTQRLKFTDFEACIPEKTHESEQRFKCTLSSPHPLLFPLPVSSPSWTSLSSGSCDNPIKCQHVAGEVGELKPEVD